jgi:putative ABC transport system permease protein
MIVKDVPNVFLINLEHTQVAKLEEYLSQKKISHSPIYPMVRGRLIKINGIAVGELFKDKAKPRSLLRELNLSTSKQLAKNNKVIRGAFTTHSVKGQNTVSVEAGMAKRVGIGLNDELSFSVSGEELKAVVTSIRTVEWTSFNPNFFMIFNPQALKDYPKTYITSFHVKDRRERVMTELIKKFPNASIIDLTGIISSIQILVDAIKQALLFIVGFALLAAVVVILLLYLSFSNERHKDARIFTLFGLNAKHIRRMQWREPAFIGLSSGIAVSVCSYFSNFLLIEGILNIQFEPQLTIVLLPIVLSVFLMSLLYRFLP